MDSLESGAKGKQDKISRRTVLKGLVGVGALTAMPTAVRAASYREWLREREKQDEAYFQKLVRDPGARRQFQEAPTQKELGAVMRSLAKKNAKWIDAFKQDEKRMHGGALALRDGSGAFKGNGTILKIPMGRQNDGTETNRYLVATVAHVADKVPPTLHGTQWTRHPHGRDVAVRELHRDEAERLKEDPTNALVLAPLQRGKEDITGETGAVIAYGNGEDAPVRKLYPSPLSPKISSKVLTAMNVGLSKTEKYMREEDIAAVRMIVLPAHESQESLDNQPPPINRTSGGAFVYKPRGSKEMTLGGLFVAGAVGNADGESYDVGYVLDHLYIRETIAEHFKDYPRP